MMGGSKKVSNAKSSFLNHLEDNLLMIPLTISIILTLISFAVQIVSGSEAAAFYNRLAYYAYAWVASLGLAVCCRDQRHIRINMIEKALPPAGKKVVQALSYLISLVILIGMLWGCWNVLNQALADGTMDSVATHVPVCIAYFAPVVGFAAGTIRHILRLFRGGDQ